MGVKTNIAKAMVVVVDNTPINVNNVLIENVQGYVYLVQHVHYSLKEKNQDKEIQRRIMQQKDGRLGGIHQTPGYLPKQHCHLPGETDVQLLCAATYDPVTLTKQAQNKLADDDGEM